MALSLRLVLRRANAAWRALGLRGRARGGDGGASQVLGRPSAPRPGGRLLWVHLAQGHDPVGASVLLSGLCAENPELTLLLTGQGWPAHLDGIRQATPLDTPPVARSFLQHWRPDAVLWVGDAPMPDLWDCALSAGIPIGAVEADPSHHPFPLIAPMQRFTFLHGLTARPRLKNQEHAGPLARIGAPPPCDRAARDAMSQRISTRPVWLAAGVPEVEIAGMIEAHRIASHHAHRLLLILVPADPADGPALAERLETDGWAVSRHAAAQEAERATQIYVADTPEETGLWYRLAAITYLGGSLSGGAAPPDPAGPAALGSAVLCGWHPGTYGETVSRLQGGGALRRVADGAELGHAVAGLLDPDRAAEMARAAWELATEGAEASHRALVATQAMLEGDA